VPWPSRQALIPNLIFLSIFLLFFSLLGASPRLFFFGLSTAWFSRMATAGLEATYFNPVVF
jgi:hypothetical protein